jgi:hypothetical protein
VRRAVTIALVLFLCSGCDPKSGSAATSGNSEGQAAANSDEGRNIAPDGKAVVEAIKNYLGPDKRVGEKARFTAAFTDLDGDGKDEAIVYLVDSSFCGSGGCNTYVLTQAGLDAWHVIGNLTITHPPIYKLLPGKDGWAELGVTVYGGGLARMVMAVPHGNGGYASNPTVAPSRPIDPRNAKVLISQEATLPQAGG